MNAPFLDRLYVRCKAISFGPAWNHRVNVLGPLRLQLLDQHRSAGGVLNEDDARPELPGEAREQATEFVVTTTQ